MGSKGKSSGTVFAILSYVMWGMFPVYWKALQSVSPVLIIAHRILWAFIALFIYMLSSGRMAEVKMAIKIKSNILNVFGCAVLITINWFIYVLAVNTGHIVESSMGYYINPLVSILLGVIFLKEKLGVYKIIALALAAFGVGYMIFEYGSIPWISLILAFSFGIYGLLKKLSSLSSASGLMLETAILTPLSLGYILFIQFTEGNAFFTGTAHIPVLLVCAGIITAIPLLLFAYAAQRIELSTIGLLQYIAPTMMLLFGVFLYGEQFTLTHFISFGLIWSGLTVYFLSLLNPRNNKRRTEEKRMVA